MTRVQRAPFLVCGPALVPNTVAPGRGPVCRHTRRPDSASGKIFKIADLLYPLLPASGGMQHTARGQDIQTSQTRLIELGTAPIEPVAHLVPVSPKCVF